MPTNTRDILAKTADYTVTGADEGAIITNRGAAGAVVVTLPTSPQTGFWCEIAVIADYSFTVASGTADTMITYNDATTDSIAWAVATEIIGGGAKFIYDGTGWICQFYVNATEAATPVLATLDYTT